jgi:hypothetical protein
MNKPSTPKIRPTKEEMKSTTQGKPRPSATSSLGEDVTTTEPAAEIVGANAQSQDPNLGECSAG